MNAITEQINYAGKAFVDFSIPMLIQSGLLIFFLFALDFILRNRVRAVFRYCIWLLVLIKLILPPSISTPVGVGNLFGDKLMAIKINQQASVNSAGQSKIQQVPFPDVPSVPEIYQKLDPAGTALRSLEWQKERAKNITPVAALAGNTSLQKEAALLLTWQGAAFVVWLIVVFAMLLLLLQRAAFVRGLVRQAEQITGGLNDLLQACCISAGVKGKITLKASPNATSPAVCGLVRPVILLPGNLLSKLNREQVKAVLFHELVHIKRGDLWVNFVQTLLQIIYFYNPLLWLANAVIRRVREQAVDEAVQVALGESAESYPQILLDVAKMAFKRPALSLRLIGVVESKSALKGRIARMLSHPIPKKAKLGFTGMAVIFIAACILLPMAKGERQIDFESLGVTINRGDSNIGEYSEGSQLMRTYMEALFNGDEEKIANITSSANNATKQLRLSFNEIDKLKTDFPDPSYLPSCRRTLSVKDTNTTAKIGLFFGGRIKRIDGIRYHLMAVIAQDNNGLWQLKDTRWYNCDEAIQQAEKTLNEQISHAVMAIKNTLKSDKATGIDETQIAAALSRLSKIKLKRFENDEHSESVLNGYKVSIAKEDIATVVRKFIAALRVNDRAAIDLTCPGGLRHKIYRLPELCSIDAIQIEQIYSNKSFAIVLTKGLRRRDGLPLQLGFTFIVYPGGKWVFNDTDWLTSENRTEFISGFKKNFPDVQNVSLKTFFLKTDTQITVEEPAVQDVGEFLVNSEDLDKIRERLKLTQLTDEEIRNYIIADFNEAIQVIDLVSYSQLRSSVNLIEYKTPPKKLSDLGVETQKKIYQAALKWAQNPYLSNRILGLRLGLWGGWPEFIDMAVDTLNSDFSYLTNPIDEKYEVGKLGTLAGSICRYKGSLSANQINNIKRTILTNKHPEISCTLFSSLLLLPNLSEQNEKICWELAESDNTYIWYKALTYLHMRYYQKFANIEIYPEKIRSRAILTGVTKANDEEKQKAYKLLPDMLTTDLIQADYGIWHDVFTQIIKNCERSKATEILINHLMNLSDKNCQLRLAKSSMFSVYREPAVKTIIQTINSWYGLNLANLGTNEESVMLNNLEIENAIQQTIHWYEKENRNPAGQDEFIENKLSFGPVIDINVNDNVSVRKDSIIDFDTGKLFSLPEDWLEKKNDARLKWIIERGLDASGATRASVKGLMCEDMIIDVVPNSYWDKQPPDQLATFDLWEIGKAGTPAYMTAQGTLPVTYIFKSREGGIGVLQITGFNDEPSGVKIRYKMVKNPLRRVRKKAEPRESELVSLPRGRLMRS